MQQIRLKTAEMQLAALEAEYTNANWTYSQRIKELRQAIAMRDSKHKHLQNQLTALKFAFKEHRTELGWAVSEMAKVQASESPAKQSLNCSSNASKSRRHSPKYQTKRMFFRTAKQNSQQLALTANLTTISAVSLRTRLLNDRTHVNPQRECITAAIRGRNSRVIFKSSPDVNQLRQTTSPNHPAMIMPDPGSLSPRSQIHIKQSNDFQ